MTVTQELIDKWRATPNALTREESDSMHKYLVRQQSLGEAAATSGSDEYVPDDPDELLAEMSRQGIDFKDGADFVNDEIDPPYWIIPDLIAKGMKGDLFGKGKSHKTFFGLQLATKVSLGEKFLAWSIPHPHKVAYFNLELMPYFMQERMIAQMQGKACPTGRMFIFNMRGKATQLREHIGLIEKWLQLNGVELVIIDPRYKLMQEGEDENTAAGLRAILELRDRLLVSCAVLLIGHDPKGDVAQKSKMDRGAGSYTAGADCDFAFYLTPHSDGDDDHVVVSTTNRNRRATDDFTADFDSGTLSFSIDESLAPMTGKSSTQNMTPSERAKLNEQKYEALKMAALEVAEKFGDELLGTDAFKDALQRTPAGASLGLNVFDKKFKALLDNGVLVRQLEQERTSSGGRKNKYRARTLVSTPERIEKYLSQFDVLDV